MQSFEPKLAWQAVAVSLCSAISTSVVFAGLWIGLVYVVHSGRTALDLKYVAITAAFVALLNSCLSLLFAAPIWLFAFTRRAAGWRLAITLGAASAVVCYYYDGIRVSHSTFTDVTLAGLIGSMAAIAAWLTGSSMMRYHAQRKRKSVS